MKKVLKGGTVVSGEGCKKADVLVEDGKIGAVAPEITDEEAEVSMCRGSFYFPDLSMLIPISICMYRERSLRIILRLERRRPYPAAQP